MTTPARQPRTDSAGRPRGWPALVMGLGLGGFVDGIVLHQILQWHHMISDTDGNPVTTVEGLKANTTADGFFHAVTWLLVLAAALAMLTLWRSGRPAPPWRSTVGLLLAGWGLFNLVEGVIDHMVLGVHHVRDDLGGPMSWDIAFLVLGALLVAVGAALHSSAQPRTDAARADSAVTDTR